MVDENDLDPLYVQTLLLSKVITRILEQKAEIVLSRKPQIELKPITEFKKRMRVTSIEKFDVTTYIATVNFYITEDDMKAHKALGAIIIYVSERYVADLLKKLGYPLEDQDDQEALEDACGTLCNLIAGKFNSGLNQLGYKELVMSHFSAYRNEVLNGVEFDPQQDQKYQISFFIKGQKQVMAELTMGSIPKLDE